MSDQQSLLFTPPFRATRVNLFEPDKQRKMPDGKIVGNDNFKVQGFFDPATKVAGDFLRTLASGYISGKGISGEAAKAALNLCFPLVSSLKARGKKVPDAIPENYRRLQASTKYGPVEVVNRAGQPITSSTLVFPGVWLIAQVNPNYYEDQKTGMPLLSLYLGPVMLDKADTRISFGAAVSARQAFAHLTGGQSSVDPFASDDDVPF